MTDKCDKLIRDTIDYAYEVQTGNNTARLVRKWKTISRRYLMGKEWCFRFNRSAFIELFEQGQWGYNWKRLHETKKEDRLSCNARAGNFASELLYCSDRMSLDRWMRCHWLFNSWVSSLREQNGMKL